MPLLALNSYLDAPVGPDVYMQVCLDPKAVDAAALGQ